MILYILIAAFVGGLAVGGGGVKWWDNAAEARHEREQAAAQAKLEQANEVAQKAIEEGIAAQQKGYDEGLAKGKAQGVRVVNRVADVTKTGAFVNPACVATPEALRLYTAALGSVRGGKVPDDLLTVSEPATAPPVPAVTPAAVAPTRPVPANPLAKKP